MRLLWSSAVAFAMLLSLGAVSSIDRSRSWQQEWGTGPFSEIRDLVAQDDLVFVAAAGGRLDVRAHAARSGLMQWQAAVSSSQREGGATSLTLGGGRLFAGGEVVGGTTGADWAVVAIDPVDGATLWQDTYDHRGLGDRVGDVALSGDLLIAAGTVSSSIRLGGEYLVRAYDAATGALRWQDLRSTGGNDSADHVVADAGGVWVAGVIGPRTIPDLFVRAYEPATGKARWSRRIDTVEDEFPTGLAKLAGRLLVIGESGGGWLVQAYDAADGKPLWSHIDSAALQPAGVAAGRGRFVVTGAAFEVDGYDMLTRCYDARSGAVLWEDRYSVDGESVYGRSVYRRQGVVVVAGTVFSPPPAGHRLWVRALDLSTGSLLWEYGFEVVNSDEEPSVVTLQRNRLIVGGLRRPFDATSNALLLGYKAPR